MNDGEFPQNPNERTPRPRRTGPAVDLTGIRVRLAATVLVIGVGALILFFVIQLSQGQETADVVTPSPEATTDLSQPMATFTPGATSTPPPQDIPPTVPPEPTAPPAGILAAGANALITGTGGSGANMRSTPEVGANNLVATLADETAVTVLEGPTEAADYVWWKIRTADGQEGWVVQDYLTAQ